MTRKDVFLMLLIASAAAVIALFLRLGGRQDGARLIVTIDGELFGEYSLLEDRTIEVEGTFGYNRIVIKNGSAYMESADCPDKYCMTYKPIASTNESIICLPHRLVAEVAGAKNTDEDDSVPDVVVQ